jgi:hypothetical protein
MLERFRSRVFKQAMEDGVHRFEEYQRLFTEILGDDDCGKRLTVFLHTLAAHHKRQGLRFLELCFREAEPKRWAEFLTHEQTKSESLWREKLDHDPEDDVVRLFAKRLPQWWENIDHASWVNQRLIDVLAEWQQLSVDLTELEGLLGGFEPTIDECRIWRLILLRTVLRKIIRGEST